MKVFKSEFELFFEYNCGVHAWYAYVHNFLTKGDSEHAVSEIVVYYN